MMTEVPPRISHEAAGIHCVYGQCRAGDAIHRGVCNPGCYFQGSVTSNAEMLRRIAELETEVRTLSEALRARSTGLEQIAAMNEQLEDEKERLEAEVATNTATIAHLHEQGDFLGRQLDKLRSPPAPDDAAVVEMAKSFCSRCGLVDTALDDFLRKIIPLIEAQQRERDAKLCEVEEEPATGEMPIEIIRSVIAQDTVAIEKAIIASVRATKKSIAAAIRAQSALSPRRREQQPLTMNSIGMGDEMHNETLGEALPREMARVRDEVMPPYFQIGPAGRFALAMMRASLDRAAKAMASGDVVEMIHAYKELKDYSA